MRPTRQIQFADNLVSDKSFFFSRSRGFIIEKKKKWFVKLLYAGNWRIFICNINKWLGVVTKFRQKRRIESLLYSNCWNVFFSSNKSLCGLFFEFRQQRWIVLVDSGHLLYISNDPIIWLLLEKRKKWCIELLDSERSIFICDSKERLVLLLKCRQKRQFQLLDGNCWNVFSCSSKSLSRLIVELSQKRWIDLVDNWQLLYIIIDRIRWLLLEKRKERRVEFLNWRGTISHHKNRVTLWTHPVMLSFS